MDLQSSFWQVLMDGNDAQKTAFATRGGLYQFTVMPFGLANTPATFERLMELVMRGLHWKRCLIYLDDIIIFGSTFDSTTENFRLCLSRLRQSNLKVKPSKCQLYRTSVPFLGHIISRDSITVDPAKVAAITDWPRPRCVKDVRSFLGLASYYRRFIPDFATDAAPLTRLTVKSLTFGWSDECQRSFETLKQALVTKPMLAYPSRTGRFFLETDASDVGIGAVLCQEQGTERKVLAYGSKTLSRSQRNYCTTLKEL
jgi:hypothetical protein